MKLPTNQIELARLRGIEFGKISSKILHEYAGNCIGFRELLDDKIRSRKRGYYEQQETPDQN